MYSNKRNYRGVKRAKARNPGKKLLIKKAVVKEEHKIIDQRILRVMNRNTEHKWLNLTVDNANLYNYTFDGAGATFKGSALCLSPANGFNLPAQGTGQGDRIGNKIKTKKCIFRFELIPQPYDGTLNPQPQPMDIVMYIFKVKNTNSLTGVQAIVTASFFQAGDNSAAFTGALSDANKLVNSDLILLHKRRIFKLGQAQPQLGAAASTAIANYALGNNDYKFNCIVNMDVTKYLYKTYTFNDTATVTDETQTLVLFEVMNASGVAMTAGEVAAKISYGIHYQFTDA